MMVERRQKAQTLANEDSMRDRSVRSKSNHAKIVNRWRAGEGQTKSRRRADEEQIESSEFSSSELRAESVGLSILSPKTRVRGIFPGSNTK